MPIAEIRTFSPIGIIFTGGPGSVYEADSPQIDPAVFELGVPVLGICYGCQLLAHNLGGQVTPAQNDSAREYGKTETWYDVSCPIFKGLPERSISWMSHGTRAGKSQNLTAARYRKALRESDGGADSGERPRTRADDDALDSVQIKFRRPVAAAGGACGFFKIQTLHFISFTR